MIPSKSAARVRRRPRLNISAQSPWSGNQAISAPVMSVATMVPTNRVSQKDRERTATRAARIACPPATNGTMMDASRPAPSHLIVLHIHPSQSKMCSKVSRCRSWCGAFEFR